MIERQEDRVGWAVLQSDGTFMEDRHGSIQLWPTKSWASRWGGKPVAVVMYIHAFTTMSEAKAQRDWWEVM